MLRNCGPLTFLGCALACGQTEKSDTSGNPSNSSTGTDSSVPTSSSGPVIATSGGNAETVAPVAQTGVNPESGPTSAAGSTTTNPNAVAPVESVAPSNVDPAVSGSASNTSQDPTSGQQTTTDVEVNDCGVVPSATLSQHIATVGIVTFTSTTTVTSAKIEFKPTAGGPTITAPVDLEAPDHRTLLLGMKPDTMYTYKVIVNDTCASAEQQLATTSIPLTVDVPDISVTPGMSAGYYVVSIVGGAGQNVILDGDGEIVWYGPVAVEEGGFGGTGSNSRAKLDYESKYMWSLAGNPMCCTGSGGMNRVSMDGAEVITSFSEVDKRHHDIAALPGGIMTFLVHSGECSAVVERSPDGSVKTIVADTSTMYQPGQECHPNSIHYHVEDDTYTMGDRQASLYVKFKRTGELLWQLGAANPKGPIFEGAGTWPINHGHHLFTQDGKLHFLLFNNGDFGGNSVIREFELDEANLVATPTWTYDQDLSASVLGDVQRLPNGNTMVSYTEAGVIREVNAASETVGEFVVVNGQVGYVDYRPTLYGTPTKAKLDYKFE